MVYSIWEGKNLFIYIYIPMILLAFFSKNILNAAEIDYQIRYY